MINKNKVVATSLSALLLTTSLSSAQTVVSGNLNIGISSRSADSKTVSDTIMSKEAQINIRNSGNLNFGGGKYVAGFSLEYDGNDHIAGLSTGTTTTANGTVVGNLNGATHFENNYIDLIFGNTLLTVSNDHLKPANQSLTDIIGGPHNVVTITGSAAGSTAGSGTATAAVRSIADTILTGEKYDNKGFGVGGTQTFPNFGAVSYFYTVNSDGSNAMNDTQNAFNTLGSGANSGHSVGFLGNFGIKDLTVHAGYNVQESPQTLAGVNNDITLTTFGVRYKMGNFTVAGDLTEVDYNITANAYKLKGLGLAYQIDKDIAVGFNHIRSTDSASTADATEKVTGLSVGYSLGPVALTLTGGRVQNANAQSGRDGKAVGATLGVTF